MSRITVAIPTHSMTGGQSFLRQSFNSFKKQTFKDFDIVVSDNSEDDLIEDVCNEYIELPITYFKNPLKGMAQNTNSAIKASKGELIKVLYLDDFLFGETALSDINKFFKPTDQWLVTGCVHTVDGEEFYNPHYPNYHDKIYEGGNTIGSPSVLTIRNKDPQLFDENLTWLLDVDLYKRYDYLYGNPRVINSLNVVIRIHPGQMTNIISDNRKQDELEYLIKKYT